jgi:hypothetical protein
MITLLGSLLGFFSGIIPGILDYFSKKDDRAFQLKKLEMMQSMNRDNLEHQLDKIHMVEANKPSDIKWVEAIRGLVRPAITFVFIGLLCTHLWLEYQSWYSFEWTEELQVIFATIISFWFGNRAVNKIK